MERQSLSRSRTPSPPPPLPDTEQVTLRPFEPNTTCELGTWNLSLLACANGGARDRLPRRDEPLRPGARHRGARLRFCTAGNELSRIGLPEVLSPSRPGPPRTGVTQMRSVAFRWLFPRRGGERWETRHMAPFPRGKGEGDLSRLERGCIAVKFTATLGVHTAHTRSHLMD